MELSKAIVHRHMRQTARNQDLAVLHKALRMLAGNRRELIINEPVPGLFA